MIVKHNSANGYGVEYKAADNISDGMECQIIVAYDRQLYHPEIAELLQKAFNEGYRKCGTDMDRRAHK